MKLKVKALFFILLTMVLVISAAWPKKVKTLHVESGKKTVVQDSLAGGVLMEDLSWAWDSQNACFPATQASQFRGKHKFYAFEIPPYSEVEIRVTPEKEDINIYGYQVSNRDFSTLPPNLNGVVACEAGLNYKGANPGQPEKMRFNAIRNSYHIVIAVTSASVKSDAKYTLSIEMKTKKSFDTSLSRNIPVVDISLDSKGRAIIKGDLSDGGQIPLEWAESSQVACFPATQFENFRGNHLFYRVQLPKYSNLKVSLKSPDNVNLYALRLGTSDITTIPPNVPSASCDASYLYGNKAPDFTRSIEMIALRNPYSILIGVAGASDITKTKFELSVDITPR
ncbi:MAG: hypothetical protein ABUK01_10535 [Leptospirales bacterium]